MKTSLAITLSLLIAFTCFGQRSYKRATTIEGFRVIASTVYKNHYLSMDNGEFFGSSYGDQGKVEVRQQIGSHELFEIKEISDGIYSIASTDIKERYLQMDGSRVSLQNKAPGGRVAIQVYIGGYEKFKIKPQGDGSYTIESLEFPGRYLHMSQDKVMVSNQVGKYERFFLLKK